MSTNHKPATPLPWDVTMADWTEHDAPYTVHAANAYPKLIEALHACVKGMPHNPAQDDAVALLREFGEE